MILEHIASQIGGIFKTQYD